jgi:hypothetical protein
MEKLSLFEGKLPNLPRAELRSADSELQASHPQ